MTIRVENTREGICVCVESGDTIKDLYAYDTNEWSDGFDDPIPADVEAVLHQIYLNCRNMAPVKWVKWTTYELDANDKMFEPIRKWLGVQDED